MSKLARKVKCPLCETMNEKTDTITIGNRYYCKGCAEKKKEESDQYKEDWDELYQYICELYGLDKPTGMMFKQLKDFKSEPYNYKISGIYLTLKYFYETLGNHVIEGSGLGIVPYYYEEAKNNYIQNFNINEKVDKFEFKEKDINIKTKIKTENSATKNQKQINFKDIDWGDE